AEHGAAGPQLLPPPVERVHRERVADGREVHPDLMRAPGLGRDVEEREGPERLAQAVPRPRRLRARRSDEDPPARPPRLLGGRADREVDDALVGWDSVDERRVTLLRLPSLEGARQLALGGEGLCEEHDAARALIEPVDEPGFAGLGVASDPLPE